MHPILHTETPISQNLDVPEENLMPHLETTPHCHLKLSALSCSR